MLHKTFLILFIANIFTIHTFPLENGEKTSLLTNVSGIVKPILNQINAMYASSTTIKISSNPEIINQKIFKRSLKEKPNAKENISTVILYGNLGDLLALSRNAINSQSELCGIQKILKRTDDETTQNHSNENKSEESGDEGPTKKLSKEDLHIGTVVEDHLGDSDLVFVEVPIKKISNAANVSDETFESMADVVPDRLDFDHQRVFCGKEAIEKIGENSHESTTINGVNSTENNVC
nr:uncharacterized protein LOC111413717 [Onthophagus taurus]